MVRRAGGPQRAPLGYRFLGVLIRSAYRLARWRIDARGFEHLPRTGGAVVVWNHTSHVDFALTACVMLDATGRWARLLAMRELWSNPLLGWAPRFAHCVPVDRDSASGGADAFAEALGVLRAGQLVMVAPEGRISGSGELQPFRTGAVRLAQAAGVPIVPTVSWGTHRFSTTGRPASPRRVWRLPVTLRVGAPATVLPDEDPVDATERLRERVEQLLADARSHQPGPSR